MLTGVANWYYYTQCGAAILHMHVFTYVCMYIIYVLIHTRM